MWNRKEITHHVLVAAMLLALSPAAVLAQPPQLLYAISSQDLLVIDKDDPSNVDVVGAHGIANFNVGSLAYNPITDRLVGTINVSGVGWQVFTFDRITGTAQTLGSPGNAVGLEFVDSRSDVVTSWRRSRAERDLYSMDSQGTFTFLASTGLDLDKTVYDSTHDVFYGVNGVIRGGGVADYVYYQVDVSTGSSTRVRTYRNTGGPSAYHAGDLAIYSIHRFTNVLNRIDLSSGSLGAATGIGPIAYTVTQIRGAAFAPPASAGDQVGALQQLVSSLELSGGTGSALLNKLDAATAALEKGQVNAAINQIEAFRNQVEAQAGKRISEEDAALLEVATEDIIEALQFLL